MPLKRKRTGEPSLISRIEKLQEEIFRALKVAKGFERQRLSKRSRDADTTPDKQQRLDREIAVLKSLDLHQTARAHLCSSLLKIKAIAASTDLPAELRRGVPKPELTEEEKLSLHNVTSGLYSREPVKQAVDRAIATVCAALSVPVPEKSKRSRKGKEEIEDRITEKSKTEAPKATKLVKREEESEILEEHEEEEDDLTDFDGFDSDVDEPGPVVGELDSEAEAVEEKEFSQYDHLLGSSTDEDDQSQDESIWEKLKGTEKVNIDDISLSGSASDVESEAETAAQTKTRSLSPEPPKKKQKVVESKSTKQSTRSATKDSTFLPSLMGGYISGSESASDVDVEPPKKRRGQRARQAIWEKKYGSRAKHLQKAAQEDQGRDSGWDMRRGAVGPDEAGRRTPWKKGVNNPFSKANNPNAMQARSAQLPRAEARRPPPKKDDEGQLHPSWQARKAAKEAQKDATFAGKKITFD